MCCGVVEITSVYVLLTRPNRAEPRFEDAERATWLMTALVYQQSSKSP
jgi:hypothetical protein